MTAIDVVPVDLTPWFAGDADDRRRVARLVDEACSTSGFLSVTGHGIDEGLIERMLEVTTAYFDLPLEEKLRHVAEDRAANRGYAAQGTEALSYSIGEESPPDLFEAFNIGREVVPEGVDEAAAAAYMAPNVWPDRPEGFRETWLAYWDAVEQLGLELVDVFAVALGQPDGWFRPFVDRSISVMRANNYERRAGAPDPLEGQLRMGARGTTPPRRPEPSPSPSAISSPRGPTTGGGPRCTASCRLRPRSTARCAVGRSPGSNSPTTTP